MSVNNNVKSLTNLVVIAMFSAVSIILFFFEFPVISALPHLKLDFSDIPALLAGVIFGPVWGVVVELVKNFVELIIKGLGSQLGFGNIMNFVAGCAFVVPFSIIFRKFDGKKSYTSLMIMSAIPAFISIIIFGIIGNYIITPPFFKYFLGINLDNATLWAAIWGATAINAIKGAMLAIVAFFIIRPVKKAIEKVL